MNSIFRFIIIFLIFLMPSQLLRSMDFIDRILFSDKAYAKHIEVKAYILSDSQASSLLADPSKEPIQLIGSELSKFPRKYLVVRVKNLGHKHAWGTLACSVPAVWNPIKIPILSMGDQDFCNYLISLEGISVVYSFETFAPEITFEWAQLYTK